MKNIGVFFLIILTSFYLFPFEFQALPGVNTKMVMAGIALIIIAIELIQKRMPQINRDFFIVFIYAFAISVIALVSYVWNGTHDYSFVRYPLPVFVWWAGAYTLYSSIKVVHKSISIELIARYLIVVCVLQCVLALVIDQTPPFKSFVNSVVGGKEGFMIGLEGRLSGIGCALDVAGGRFAAVMVIIAFLSVRKEARHQSFWMIFYIISTIVLILIGNMIGRTTTVGVIVAFAYWLYRLHTTEYASYFVKRLSMAIICLLPFIIYLYHSNDIMYDYTRFAFEGFFSLWEKGEWDVTSNNALKEMVVFPDNLKTWIIGDAFAMNPSEYEPYYIGPMYKGFYKQTDIGYLRFIFYFGILGCMAMVIFISQVAKICINRFVQYKMMFLMLLVVNLLIWTKVTSDIFLVFALFLCVPREVGSEVADANEI